MHTVPAAIITANSAVRPVSFSSWDGLAFLGLVLGGLLLLHLIYSVTLVLMLNRVLRIIPIEDRDRISPGRVWLLLIPIFNLVWNFFVFPRVSQSFQFHFERIGRPQPGDCGKTLAVTYSVIAACAVVVGAMAIVAGLVLIILIFCKFAELKRKLLAGGVTAQGFPVLPLPD